MGLECGASGRVKDQGAIVVEADFLWDPVGGDDVFRARRLWICVVGGDSLAEGWPERFMGLKVPMSSGGPAVVRTAQVKLAPTNLPTGSRPRLMSTNRCRRLRDRREGRRDHHRQHFAQR